MTGKDLTRKNGGSHGAMWPNIALQREWMSAS